MDGSYLFRGYGVSVRVDAPADISLSDLQTQIAPEVAGEECAVGPSDLHLTRWNGEYHLLHGERRYGPYRTLQNALRGLSNGVHFMIGKHSPMTFLHAGAVEIDSAAVVFPGSSRWGKSTLVNRLVEEGCGYLSDEYAVISPEGTVFPLSKPIRLRSCDGDRRTKYRHLPSVGAPGGLPCAALILTRFETSAKWNPIPLTSGTAVLRTLPSALRSHDSAEQVMRSLTAMTREAACYQSAHGDNEPSADAIRALSGVSSSVLEVRA